jgi:NADPH:quinone reductase-like Zn-dependent oxidoreductase
VWYLFSYTYSIPYTGADETVNYARTPEWEAEVKKLTDGRGVDHVVEIGKSFWNMRQ